MHDTLIECRMKNRSQSAGQGVIAGLYYSRASLSFTFTLVLIYVSLLRCRVDHQGSLINTVDLAKIREAFENHD